MNEKSKYNGFEISFDSKTEVWYALIDEKGKPWEAGKSDEQGRAEDASLKKLKEKLDVLRRSKFERRTVFVRPPYRYRRGGGDDDKYDPQYVEATLTSIAPNGNAYYVIKGGKHADKSNLKYSAGLIIDTPENRKLIAEIDRQGKIEWEAEVAQKKAESKLKSYGPELYKQVYDKDIS